MAEPRTNEAPALRVLLPIAVLALTIVLWEAVVQVGQIPPYVLPSPQRVFATLVSDWAILSSALAVTLITTLEGFFLAAVGGVALAVLTRQLDRPGMAAVYLALVPTILEIEPELSSYLTTLVQRSVVFVLVFYVLTHRARTGATATRS